MISLTVIKHISDTPQGVMLLCVVAVILAHVLYIAGAVLKKLWEDEEVREIMRDAFATIRHLWLPQRFPWLAKWLLNRRFKRNGSNLRCVNIKVQEIIKNEED